MSASKTVEVDGVVYNIETRIATVNGEYRPFTAEEETTLPSWADYQDYYQDLLAIEAEDAQRVAYREAASQATQQMFEVTDVLIAWANDASLTKYSLDTLGPLKVQVQAAMFAYRDVPTEYKNKDAQAQYDYLAGRSVEVAFEIAAAALQSVGQLQAVLTQKGILP